MDITVCSALGSNVILRVHPWLHVKDVKDMLQDYLGIDAKLQRVFHNGVELNNTHTLNDCNITNESKLMVASSDAHYQQSSDIVAYGVEPESVPGLLKELMKEARQGLALGHSPRLSMEGVGGTYFLRDRNRENIAVFKACDEEAFCVNNPKGYTNVVGEPNLNFRAGVLAGEGHLREVAAFLLDHGGFACVPATIRVEMPAIAFKHETQSSGMFGMGIGHMPMVIREDSGEKFDENATKVGSFQEFVEYDDMCGDLAPQKFQVREVHKIAILDIRMCNMDRNDANILVKRGGGHVLSTEQHETELIEYVVNGRSYTVNNSLQLTPIDHSYSLPDTIEVAWTDVVWYGWPQVHVPFDDETRAYIEAIDIKKDMELLRTQLSIREECLLTLRITTTLLKCGAAHKLTLHEIATIWLRQDMDEASQLEKICSQAQIMAKSVSVCGPHPTSDHNSNSGESKSEMKESPCQVPMLQRSVSCVLPNEPFAVSSPKHGFQVRNILVPTENGNDTAASVTANARAPFIRQQSISVDDNEILSKSMEGSYKFASTFFVFLNRLLNQACADVVATRALRECATNPRASPEMSSLKDAFPCSPSPLVMHAPVNFGTDLCALDLNATEAVPVRPPQLRATTSAPPRSSVPFGPKTVIDVLSQVHN